MSHIAKLRDLYIPIQPTVKKTAIPVEYLEFLPAPVLQNYIYCYWELKTTELLEEPFHYRVIADGCIDIFFELNRPAENFVMGFCKKYTEFPLGNSFHYVGVRFLPSMFPQLFKIDASDLSNKFEALDFVLPKTAHFISNQFQKSLDQNQIKSIFDSYFLKLVEQVAFDFDNRFYDALQIILKNGGVVNLEKEINTGISPRQLRRLFNYYVGVNAKTFSKVVRFQNIFRAKPSRQSLRKNKLFYDVGYYDHSHFIKEFKNFYGATPSKVFNRE